MKRTLLLFTTLLSLALGASAQQTYFPGSVPPSSTSFSPTFRWKAGLTDSLKNMYMSIGGNWYQVYTAPQSWYVPVTRQIINGYGITGGHALSTDVTLAVDTTSLHGVASKDYVAAHGGSGAFLPLNFPANQFVNTGANYLQIYGWNGTGGGNISKFTPWFTTFYGNSYLGNYSSSLEIDSSKISLYVPNGISGPSSTFTITGNDIQIQPVSTYTFHYLDTSIETATRANGLAIPDMNIVRAVADSIAIAKADSAVLAGSVNIGNSDLTLTGNRLLTQNNNTLTFKSVNGNDSTFWQQASNFAFNRYVNKSSGVYSEYSISPGTVGIDAGAGIGTSPSGSIIVQNTSTGVWQSRMKVVSSTNKTQQISLTTNLNYIKVQDQIGHNGLHADSLSIYPLKVASSPWNYLIKKVADSLYAAAGSGITALTGDVTASGSGSVAATVAQINGITKSYYTFTSDGQAQLNGKELLANKVNSLDNSTSHYLSNSALTNVIGGKVIPSSTMLNIGDSFTTGVGATSSIYDYVQRISSQLYLTSNNLAINGTGVFTGIKQLYLNTPSIATNYITWLYGFNDLRLSGNNAKTYEKLKGEFRALIVNNSLQAATAASTLTKTGTWTNVTAGTIQSKSELQLSTTAIKTSDLTATITYTFSGNNLVIGTFGVDDVITKGGTISVSVDGLAGYGTFDSRGKADGLTDVSGYNNAITHNILYIPNCGSGSHTAIVSVTSLSSGGAIYLDFFGTLNPPQICKPIYWGDIPYMNATGYTLGSPYNNASTPIMQAGTAAYQWVMSEFTGYPVYEIFTNSFYNLASDVSADNIHPNNIGHFSIARAFLAQVTPSGFSGNTTLDNVVQRNNTTTIVPNFTNGILLDAGSNNITIGYSINDTTGVTHPLRVSLPYDGGTNRHFQVGVYNSGVWTSALDINSMTGATTITGLGTGFVKSTTGLLSSSALTSGDITTALGFTPAPIASPSFTGVSNFGGIYNSGYSSNYDIQIGTESGNHGILIRSGTTGIGKLSFDNGNNGDGTGRIWYDYTANAMKFYTSHNGTDSHISLTLDNNQNATFAGTATATSFIGAGTGLTGTAASLTAANITATSNSTLTTLSALSLPYSQLTGTPSSLSVGSTENIAAGSTAGSLINIPAATLTDNITASGTVTDFATIGTAQTTLAAANTSITYTNGFGAYFTAPTNGTNVTMTNKYALGLAFDATHRATFAVNSSGALTLNAPSTVTITPALTVTGVLTTGANIAYNSTIGSAATNLFVGANSTVSNVSTAAYLFGGAANMNFRVALGSTTASGTLPINSSTAGIIFPTANYATNASGTHAWLTAVTINPLGTITNTGAALTNAATMFVGAAPTTVATNKYTAYFDTGNIQVANGNLTLGTAGNGLFITEGTNGRVGQVALVAGTKAITITGLTTSSRAKISFVSIGGTVTTTWQYAGVCTANTLTITALTSAGATDTTDTSTVNYFVIN